LDAGWREVREELRTLHRHLVTVGELRAWVGVLIALLGVAVGVILQYG
jgi:hypothetical protein